MALVELPCGCIALEIDDDQVLVVRDCDGDEGDTMRICKRTYFNRPEEAKPVSPKFFSLEPWITRFHIALQDAEKYRDAKQVLRGLLS